MGERLNKERNTKDKRRFEKNKKKLGAKEKKNTNATDRN